MTKDLTRVFRVRSTSGEGAKASRKELVAVDRLNLDIEPGELFGLLGRNGAGKTTTIRMLSTLIEPTSGRASVAGFDVARQPTAVRASIGVFCPASETTMETDRKETCASSPPCTVWIPGARKPGYLRCSKSSPCPTGPMSGLRTTPRDAAAIGAGKGAPPQSAGLVSG